MRIHSMSFGRKAAAALICAAAAIGLLAGGARAQSQPWGLPPPPPGVGPVELFADVHDTPQGKFLEGGAFDTDGNFWFVAIDTGWVSYLTPAGKLVPAFNCDPPEEFGARCEPQGTRWHDGKLYLTTRHIGIIVYDPQTKKFSPVVSTFRNQLFKGPNDLDFDADGNLYFTDPWGTGAGPDTPDTQGSRVPIFQGRDSSAHHFDRSVPEWHRGVAGQQHARRRRLCGEPDALLLVPARAGAGLRALRQRSVEYDVFLARSGSFNPGAGGPDGIHYDVKGNLWAAMGIGGVIEYDPRGIILGYVPLPNGDVATNLAFGGENNQVIYMEGAVTGTVYKFKAPLSRVDRPRRRAEQAPAVSWPVRLASALMPNACLPAWGGRRYWTVAAVTSTKPRDLLSLTASGVFIAANMSAVFTQTGGYL